MGYSALTVAKYIISKCTIEYDAISNLQLQRILYYIQKWFLQNGLIAFDDDFEAWQFGPVVPSVYNRYSSFGGMPIRLKYHIALDSNYMDIIDPIITSKRDLKPWVMADDIKHPGKAWDRVFEDGKGSYRIISKDLIREESPSRLQVTEHGRAFSSDLQGYK